MRLPTKHVPLMEGKSLRRPSKNNVVGTQTVAEAARRFSAERFMLISTDKAVNPTSVVGCNQEGC